MKKIGVSLLENLQKILNEKNWCRFAKKFAKNIKN